MDSQPHAAARLSYRPYLQALRLSDYVSRDSSAIKKTNRPKNLKDLHWVEKDSKAWQRYMNLTNQFLQRLPFISLLTRESNVSYYTENML